MQTYRVKRRKTVQGVMVQWVEVQATTQAEAVAKAVEGDSLLLATPWDFETRTDGPVTAEGSLAAGGLP